MISKIWSHRGVNHEYPENTIPAFKRAIELGVDGIEIDVQRTKDNKLVVIHDENLNRLTGVNKYIYECKYDEIKNLEIYTPHFTETKAPIPLLEEVLELIKNNSIELNIELKNSFYFYPNLEDQVVEMVKKHGVEDKIYYSSFNHQSMAYLANLGFGEKCGILYADIIYKPVFYNNLIGIKNFHPLINSLNDDNYMKEVHEAGMRAHVWTVNSEDEIKLSLKSRVDAIITDEPELALKLRKKFK